MEYSVHCVNKEERDALDALPSQAPYNPFLVPKKLRTPFNIEDILEPLGTSSPENFFDFSSGSDDLDPPFEGLPDLTYLPAMPLHSGATSDDTHGTYSPHYPFPSTSATTTAVIKEQPRGPPPSSLTPQVTQTLEAFHMKKFSSDELEDLKHIVYNFLVDNYNGTSDFVKPYHGLVGGEKRQGFFFNVEREPEKRLPEIYAWHIRCSRLDLENIQSHLIQDLYKFYLRAFLDLLAKYFEKVDKYLFLYDEEPLFVPGETLAAADMRIKGMSTLSRKRKSTAVPTRKDPAQKRTKKYSQRWKMMTW